MCGIVFAQDCGVKADPKGLLQDAKLAACNENGRGQNGFGIVYSNGKKLYVQKFFGWVASILTFAFLKKIARWVKPRRIGIHLRYPTTGKNKNTITGESEKLVDYQPHMLDTLNGGVAYFANGDLPRFGWLRKKLAKKDVRFVSDNDGEFTLRWMAFTKESLRLTWAEAARAFVDNVPGAYSGILMTNTETIVLRDKLAMRPMVIGRKGDKLLIASETSALDIVGYNVVREVAPGEVIEILANGELVSHMPEIEVETQRCIFEHIYFSRNSSLMFVNGIPVEDLKDNGAFRAKLGRQLAVEHPVDADICVSLPSSGDIACQGFCRESGIPYYIIFDRNIYVPSPRTFIITDEDERIYIARLKYGLMKTPLRRHKRIVIVDDSIVRGTTILGVNKMLLEAGVEEIHWRVTFPPIIHPCFFGIDMKNPKKFVALNRSLKEIEEFTQSTSIGYLSIQGIEKVVGEFGGKISQFCTACCTGKYPMPV